MKRIALTFIGRDRPGIIARVSQVLSEAACNIEDATMTLLQGEFAMILIASLPTLRAEKKLKQAYGKLQKEWGLNYFWKTLPKDLVRGEKHPPGTQTYIVSVIGKDRTGIVYETSRIFAAHGLNITDLNSKLLGEGKRSVFTMILEVDIPKKFNLNRLDSDWRSLRKKLGVDVHIRPLERLSLLTYVDTPHSPVPRSFPSETVQASGLAGSLSPRVRQRPHRDPLRPAGGDRNRRSPGGGVPADYYHRCLRQGPVKEPARHD